MIASDRPREACGIFGVFGKPGEDVSRTAFFGLFSLQHRGQESAGIATADGTRISVRKAMGLVQHVFSGPDTFPEPGHIACGHVRYSTTGSSFVRNAQPIEGEFRGQRFCLGHNGNLTNADILRRRLEKQGIKFETTVDSEVIAKLIAISHASTFVDAVIDALRQLDGAYSLIIMSADTLIGVRDPRGFRPLCVGRFNDNGYVIASETCALSTVGAEFVDEVEPGMMVVVRESGMEWVRAEEPLNRALCIFEFIYLARPDSKLCGRLVHRVRRQLGHLLSKEHPAEADIVIPVPDTGNAAAIGYAEASRIRFGEGLIKNRYIARTFIQPDQRMRDMGVKMKLSPMPEEIDGKRVVVVDDSIVRGTTTRQIVQLIRDAGAVEVHLRITCPPWRYPCYFGIDTSDPREFIAGRMTVRQIGEHLGADSLGYLSMSNVIRATGLPRDTFCTACFTGRYPCPVEVSEVGKKHLFEEVEDVEEVTL